MSFNTADELGQRLVAMRLISPEQFEQALQTLPPGLPGAQDLMRILRDRHLLTPYQADKIQKRELDGLVLGEHKLLYQNASGSFARVYRAESISNGRMVGLKLLRRRWAQKPDTVVQFHREAQLCRRLIHKNIVPIYEVGSQGNYHYFTMEFVEGGNLRDFLRIRGKLSPAEATRCTLDMAEGLEYASSRKLTHRDLKMTNVLMSTRGVAKLVDFGLAGADGSGDDIQHALEYSTLEKGTSAQMNDPRSDLFFLGAIYYELLCGEPPWPRTRDRLERKRFSRYSTVRPIRSRDPNLPAE
ncbi:MAG: serine/threonine-protein kinase, partial [Planctomycetaceae bacterium]